MKSEYWLVYSGGEKLGMAKGLPQGIVCSESQAKKLAELWAPYAYYEAAPENSYSLIARAFEQFK